MFLTARLARTGNRQINAAIHRITITQARCHPDARAYRASSTARRRNSGGCGAGMRTPFLRPITSAQVSGQPGDAQAYTNAASSTAWLRDARGMAPGHRSSQLPREVVERLNDRFYRSSPHRYFELRLLSLLALDSLPDDVDESSLPCSTLGENALGGPLEFNPKLLDRGERDVYIASEAEVLLQHAREVLIRYFLGHVGGPPCPWFEMAALSDFREFKELTGALAAEDARSLGKVVDGLLFSGADLGASERESQAKVIVATLQEAARRVLGSAPLYNAAKHGFTVLAGRSALQFSLAPESEETDEDRQARQEVDELLSDHGLTLETLEWSHEAGQRRWATTTRYVDPDHAIASAWVATRVLTNIARTMEARYAGGGDVAWYSLSDEFTFKAMIGRGSGKGTVLRIPIAAIPLSDEDARAVLGGLDEIDDRDAS